MIEFARQVLIHTPIYVWVILLILVAFGARALKDRQQPAFTVLIGPAVFLVIGLVSARRGAPVFAAWMLTLLAVTALVYWRWKPAGSALFDRASKRLTVPGSVFPLAMMMTLFVLNYAYNVILVLKPELRAQWAWIFLPSVFMAALSGLFLGRALSLFRLSRG